MESCSVVTTRLLCLALPQYIDSQFDAFVLVKFFKLFYQLSQFLHKMCDMGVIKVEETMKGVESITNIDCELPLVKSAAASSDSAVGMTKQVRRLMTRI